MTSLFMQNTGTLKVNKSGLVWKKDGGGRIVEVPAGGRRDFEVGYMITCFFFDIFSNFTPISLQRSLVSNGLYSLKRACSWPSVRRPLLSVSLVSGK